jgi:Fe-S-cluster-containing hydrogenase component 2
MPIVIQHNCPQDHPCPCVRICPVDAVSQEGFSAPEIDENKCIECGKCVRFCPYQAITDMSFKENVRASSF